MLKGILRALGKIAFSEIVNSVLLDVDTVEKADGKYKKYTVEILGRVVLKKLVKVDGTPDDVYTRALNDERLQDLFETADEKLKTELKNRGIL